jgi:hypothetical protein
MSEMNLLKETINEMDPYEPKDVEWVGVYDWREYTPKKKIGWMTWAEFASVAKDFNYDNGYGGEQVELSLVVVGGHWWLERHEYDGSEWWEMKSLPTRPEKHVEPTLELLRSR